MKYGFTLIETIIYISILTMLITSLTTLYFQLTKETVRLRIKAAAIQENLLNYEKNHL